MKIKEWEENDLPFYEILAAHILNKQTFDMGHDTGDYPNIHWIIAGSLLSKFTRYEQDLHIKKYANKVKNSFEHAINHLLTQGIIVYKSIAEGKRNIDFITIDPDYAKSEKVDFDRIRRKHYA